MTTKLRAEKRATALAGPVEVRAATRETDAIDGVCGVLVGIALVYGVVDAYGTRFRPGCLDRTKREKLAAGKVKLFADHQGMTRTHIGFVKSLETQGDREVMTAYLFDTAAGREQKEYLAACMASGGYTGLSVGFYPRDTEMVTEGTEQILDFLEVELDEVSSTPRPAVPGADVMGVRTDDAARPAPMPSPEAMRAVLRVALDVLGPDVVQAEVTARTASSTRTTAGSTAASNATPTDSAAHPRNADGTDSRADAPAIPATGTPATMHERLDAVRRSYPSPR